jgi:hypothetical protein
MLFTTRFAGSSTMVELMGAINFKPLKWFNFVLNTSVSNWGPSFGFYLGVAPRYFLNMFMSVDYVPYSYGVLSSMGGIPVPSRDLSLSLNMGASIPLNRNRLYEKVEVLSSLGGALDKSGGTAIDWQKANNAKTAGDKSVNLPKVDRAPIDAAEKKAKDNMNKEREKQEKQADKEAEKEMVK